MLKRIEIVITMGVWSLLATILVLVGGQITLVCKGCGEDIPFTYRELDRHRECMERQSGTEEGDV